MKWQDAVKKALLRIYKKTNNRRVTYYQIVTLELDNIVRDTGTKGKTPEKTLSRELQSLRDKGFLTFEDNQGTYLLTDKFLEELGNDYAL